MSATMEEKTESKTEPGTGFRRLEVPVLIDRHGATWAPGAIDVTLALEGRTVLAEAPPSGFPPEVLEALREMATGLPRASSPGAVTVTFLAHPRTGEFKLAGSSPELPDAYATLEALTGFDLAALQLHLSRGGRLDGARPEPRGHACQIALSARDPEAGFAPSPGVVESLRLPAGPGLRADAVVEEGETPGESAGLAIVRVTAHGRDRAEALRRLQDGLARTLATVRGGATDKAFLTGLLDRPQVEEGTADPHWLAVLLASGDHLSRRGAEAALLEAALVAYDAELDRVRTQFYASAARGRPEVPGEIGGTFDLRYRGHVYTCRVVRLDRGLYRVEVDGQALEVAAGPPGRSGRKITCASRSWRVFSTPQGRSLLVEVDGIPHRVDRGAAEAVRSPAPAVVTALNVAQGDEVRAGTPLVVLEAMKMETTVLAQTAGRVTRLLVRRNVQVPIGAPLLEIEPAGGAGQLEGPPAASIRVRFDTLAAREDGASPSVSALQEVRRLMLGYDYDAAAVQRLVEGTVPIEGEKATRLVDDILRASVDIGGLFRRQIDGGSFDGGRRSAEDYLFTYLRDLGSGGEELPDAFRADLRRALAHYGVDDLDRSPELEESLFRIAMAHSRLARQVPPVLALLERCLDRNRPPADGFRDLLDRMIAETQGREPAVHDLAREVRYRGFDRPLLLASRERILAKAEEDLARLAAQPGGDERARRITSLVECPQPLHHRLSMRFGDAGPALREAMLEVMLRRYYRIREIGTVRVSTVRDQSFAVTDYDYRDEKIRLFATHAEHARLPSAARALRGLAEEAMRAGRDVVIDLYAWRSAPPLPDDAAAAEIGEMLSGPGFPRGLQRVAVALSSPAGTQHFTFRRTGDGGYAEETVYRGIHPMMARRLQLWRLFNFHLERLPSAEGIYLFRGTALENPKDDRLFALAEVRELTLVRDETTRDEAGRVVQLPELEHTLMEALAGIRRFQARRPPGERLHWNRVLLNLWPVIDLASEELNSLVHRLTPSTEGLGMEKVAIRCRIPDRESGEPRDWMLEISNFGEGSAVVRFRKPKDTPLKPLREYAQKVIELRRRGLVYPYELIKRLTPPREDAQADLPPGDFVEHDLDAEGRLVPVTRPYGRNQANVVVGVIRSFTGRYPDGMTRVIVLGDPSRGLGSLAEPECRRIVAALELAGTMDVPLEWFAVSAGARISMESGTENMDWIGLVLRRLVEFTQAGGEVNLVVLGINVGAQPYWNAEATMLMHTRGILIMTPEGAMVLTGKQALDYSGGVSAEDNQGIGGYERIMGPNGQAQYFAQDLGEACRILLRHYEHTWKAPGERFPRPAPTADPRDRDVCDFPHGGQFQTVGEVFSDAANPGRKKPFDIRRVMLSVADQDHAPLERWFGMRDAEIGVVWDAHLGGHPVCLLGFESRPLPRLGFVPVYGPEHWTGGTLFPLSSKKVARAINAASSNRPLVVLANLSGFDGSPESMRNWQLEYGAEIGRAVVNFKGPIVFCVISRYHGGAFVVFSNALHDNMKVAALEGTYASVIGGAPAAAVVFARDVDKRTRQDPRVAELEKALADPERTDKAALRARLDETLAAVRSEKLGVVADEFDHVHSVQRARDVGSVHDIIPPRRLRPYLIEELERGMERELERNAP